MKTSLNHSYRLVWSDVQQTFVPVPECASGRGKSSGGKASRITRTLLASLALTAGVAHAQAVLPTGGQIVGGSGSIATQGKSMTVTQTSDRMAADWQSFSIGKDHSVNFVQPSSSAVALNRVLGSDVSVIQGAINANGQVFLVNPNGVLFTKDAQVNVGAMVASTLNISTADFMAGNYQFEGASSNAIVNQGRMTAVGNGEGGGAVALIAAKITNEGSIHAHAGNVLMGAGSKVTLDLGGPVKIQVEQGALDALITQGGAIKADGGLVYLSAKAAGDLVSTVINHTGVTEAQTLATGETGQIYLMGGMQKDRIEVGGKLDASAPNGGNGGFIETSASQVTIASEAQVRSGHWLIDPTNIIVDSNMATTLQGQLADGDATVTTASGGEDAGDIAVNSGITWASSRTLTLRADRNIEINASIDASGGAGGKLALQYGQGAPADGNTASYTINASVKLKDGANFSTTLGSDGPPINYTVVNSQPDLQDMILNLNGNYALGSSLPFTANWTPIGGAGASFTGRFEGLGNTISNLTINTPSIDYVGLFAKVSGGSTSQLVTIKNLKLTDVNIAGRNQVGALVGDALYTHVENVHASGTVSGNNYVGGLVGYMTESEDTVLLSSASTSVTGKQNVGGLIGYLVDSSVKQSHASGEVTGNKNVGGLVGNLYYGSLIEDSYATGKVTGNIVPETVAEIGYDHPNNIGGLVGQVGGSTITKSYATGNVEAQNDSVSVGGLAGHVEASSLITDRFTTGNVTVGNKLTNWFDSRVGGLVGHLEYSKMERVYATGDVVAGADTTRIGGLVGETNHWTSDGNELIANAYAIGNVTVGEGAQRVGGLIGFSGPGKIQNTYAYGIVTAPSTATDVGALAGLVDGVTLTKSFWNTERNSGLQGFGSSLTGSSTTGSAGKTTAEMYSAATYPSADGWDASIWSFMAGRGAAVAGYEVGEGLPYLTNVTRQEDRVGQVITLFASGWGGQIAEQQTGADGSAYNISNWNQLQNINLVAGLGFDFELTNNLNTTSTGYAEQAASTTNSGAGWKPIGKLRPLYNEQEVSTNDNDETTVSNRWRTTGSDTPFVGTFDGKNFSITGLNINLPVAYPENPAANQIFDSNGVGLFGYVNGSSSEIRNLTLVNPNVKGSSNVGSVVGAIQDGSIRNITVQNAQVEGLYSVGGVVGALFYDTSAPVAVNLQVSSGQVAGLSDVGGAVGINEGNISQSNAAVTLTGSGSTVGGLVGDNYGVIDQSSASGAVTGGSSLGGLAGSNDGTISSSFASGDVTNTGRGTSNGGLVGSSDGIITDSYATGDVVTPATGFTGGLVGSVFGGQISRSYATGSVQASSLVGGLVGYSEDFSDSTNVLIEKSYATGAVTASSDHSGGLVGRAKNTNIQNSYATSSVSGTGFVGGLVGEFQGGSESDGPLITNSFAAGAVTGTSNVGGLVGRYSSLYPNEYSSTRNSYWDTTTTGQSTSQGGVGKTTAQMKDIALYSAWNIEDDQTLSDGYPRLTRSADDAAAVWKIKSVADTTSSSGGSSSNTDGGGDSTGGSDSSGGSSSGGSSSGGGSSGGGSSGGGSSGGGSSGGSSSNTGTGSNSTDSSSTGESGIGNNDSTTDQTAGNGGGNSSGTGSSNVPPTQPTNTAEEQQRQAAIQAAQSAVQVAAQQVSGSAAGSSGVAGNPALSSSMSTQLGAGSAGTLTSLSLSGGLAFVNVSQSQGTPETSSQPSAQATDRTAQVAQDGAGRDASGFMRVFVVNGGISLPPQINEAEQQ